MFNRFCSLLGFLLSLHCSPLAYPHHTQTQSNHQGAKIGKSKTPEFSTTAQSTLSCLAQFIACLFSGLACCRTRKTPHTNKTLQIYLLEVQNFDPRTKEPCFTPSLQHERCHNSCNLYWKPNTKLLAPFTRKFKNKTHGREGKFYFACNAHILRLEVKNKIAAKMKKEAKHKQICTPLGNQEQKNRHKFTFISFIWQRNVQPKGGK